MVVPTLQDWCVPLTLIWVQISFPSEERSLSLLSRLRLKKVVKTTPNRNKSDKPCSSYHHVLQFFSLMHITLLISPESDQSRTIFLLQIHQQDLLETCNPQTSQQRQTTFIYEFNTQRARENPRSLQGARNERLVCQQDISIRGNSLSTATLNKEVKRNNDGDSLMLGKR